MKYEKYTIWIVPEGVAYGKIQELIGELAERHGGPVFEPHMTLLSDIPFMERQELEEKAQLLGKSLSPFPVQFGEVSFSTTFFQCVFARVLPTAALLEARIKAQEVFGCGANTLFMPHVSLLYGNYDMQVREKIAHEISLSPFEFTAKSLVVVVDALVPKGQRIIELPFG